MTETTLPPSDAVRELSDKINRNRENIVGGYGGESQLDLIAKFVAPIEAERNRLKASVNDLHGLVKECHEEIVEVAQQLSERDAQVKALRDALQALHDANVKYVTDMAAKFPNNPELAPYKLRKQVEEALASTAPVSDKVRT